MRIAFVSTMAVATWGGSEELWARTALCALAAGHSVLAGVYKWETMPPLVQELQAAGAIVHERPHYDPAYSVRIYRRLQTVFGQYKPIEQALTEFQPDLICVSQGGNYDLAEGKPLREFIMNTGIPYCLVCHNYNPYRLPTPEIRRAAIAAYEQAQTVYFVSSEQAHVTQRQLARRFSNFMEIKNPVNVSGDQIEPWPGGQSIQLATVGALDVERKGQDVLLEVLSQLQWQDRAWHLNMYGSGPDEQYIRELLTMYSLSERVTLHGTVADIAAVWRHNHILLLPSRLEAAPLVIIEAMLCGRPVVATAVGTVPEWLMPGKTGFVAEACTVGHFTQALEEAWQARANWVRMGEQAYQWASNHGDVRAAESFLGQLLQLTTQPATETGKIAQTAEQ